MVELHIDGEIFIFDSEESADRWKDIDYPDGVTCSIYPLGTFLNYIPDDELL